MQEEPQEKHAFQPSQKPEVDPGCVHCGDVPNAQQHKMAARLFVSTVEQDPQEYHIDPYCWKLRTDSPTNPFPVRQFTREDRFSLGWTTANRDVTPLRPCQDCVEGLTGTRDYGYWVSATQQHPEVYHADRWCTDPRADPTRPATGEDLAGAPTRCRPCGHCVDRVGRLKKRKR